MAGPGAALAGIRERTRVRSRLRGLRDTLEYRRLLRRMAAPKLLEAFSRSYPEAFFIEIGSNDGEQHDHLEPYIRSRRWAGIMVEPVPFVFERLRRNYGSLDRITLVNVAIADHDGRMRFYHLAEADPTERDELPEWYDAIGSFSREAVLTHRDEIPDVESRLVRTEVPCLTFESLCDQHGVRELDLLLLDTEGHDFEIIKHIDLAVRHPRLLVYEHYHLSPSDRAECGARIEAAGYEAMEEGFDTWCLDTGTPDDLTNRWRGLRPAVPGVSVHDPA